MVETETRIAQEGGDQDLISPGNPLLASEIPHPPSQFRGRGEYAIDDKGRLTLPAPMRRHLAGGGSLVVLDGRAVIWDELTYRRAVDTLDRLVDGHELTTADLRAFTSNTHPVSLDGQGRIVIPHSVRIEAGLDREVLVLGAGTRIEIVPVGQDAFDASLAVPDSVVDALDRARF